MFQQLGHVSLLVGLQWMAKYVVSISYYSTLSICLILVLGVSPSKSYDGISALSTGHNEALTTHGRI
jgi:hypothetical protein